MNGVNESLISMYNFFANALELQSGTGDVELTIKESADFQKAKSLIERAYSEN